MDFKRGMHLNEGKKFLILSFIRCAAFFGAICYFLPFISEISALVFFDEYVDKFGIRVPIATSIVIAATIICVFIFSESISNWFRVHVCLSNTLSANVYLRDQSDNGKPYPFLMGVLLWLWIILVNVPSAALRNGTYHIVGYGGNWPLHGLLAGITISIFGYFLWTASVAHLWNSYSD